MSDLSYGDEEMLESDALDMQKRIAASDGRAAMEFAYRVHVHACDRWRGLPGPFDEFYADPATPSRLARPFGRPPAMPPHRWRVSWDVMQALYNASPPPSPAPNPKDSDGTTRLLFGWPIERDDHAPAGTLLLEISA